MATTMKSLRLHAVGDLRLDELPLPVPGPGEARVRVASCGVCGSDIPRIFSKGTYSFPTACGHEFAGVIDAVGDGAGDFRPGDRVAVFPLLWCGKCPACEQGRYVQCEDYDYLGSRSDGAFAECVVAPVHNLVRVPEGVTLEEASMTEPAAVALHALRRARVEPGEVVVIFGAGPIGLMQAQFARMMGAGRVVLFDVVEEKLALARSMGFADAMNSRDGDPVAAVRKMTGGRGAQVTVEGAGVPATMLAAIGAARHNGRVVLMGNPSRDVTLPMDLISQALRRELTILGTWNSTYSWSGNDDDWGVVLGAMASGALDVKPLVTHRARLDAADQVLRMIHDASAFSCKVLVKPNPDLDEA